MSKKIITSATWLLPEVGEVKFHRNIKAKRLTITIHPHKGVRVTMPGLLSFKTAQDFVYKKKEWIASKVSEMSLMRGILTNESVYKTKEHTLCFMPESRNKIHISLQDEKILICYPEGISVEHKQVQEAGRKGIEMAYRKEAYCYLPKRLDELSLLHGMNYKQIRIKNITSRWGSCSSNNNINLSIYLMKLPTDLIDYIILHELTHTIHKNHGPAFWNHLQNITGNAKGLATRVKKYRTGI